MFPISRLLYDIQHRQQQISLDNRMFTPKSLCVVQFIRQIQPFYNHLPPYLLYHTHSHTIRIVSFFLSFLCARAHAEFRALSFSLVIHGWALYSFIQLIVSYGVIATVFVRSKCVFVVSPAYFGIYPPNGNHQISKSMRSVYMHLTDLLTSLVRTPSLSFLSCQLRI